jgi:hypothetical protein
VVAVVAFEELQAELGAALALNTAGCNEPHVLVALPSFSVGETPLAHYADRIPALEHRYLLAQLMLPRIDGCEMVFVSSEAPSQEILDYYRSIVPEEHRDAMRERFRLLEVPDRSARAVAAKLLDRPDLIADLRQSFGGRPAFIEPWNVTGDEVRLAELLSAPINGTAPELWPLGFKSAGRRLFREAGVPAPHGVEDVRSVDDVMTAIDSIAAARPGAAGVVIKTDDSVAGDGNQVLRFRPGRSRDALRSELEDLPGWYLSDLAHGGVVEELVTGRRFTSPSVQVDIQPNGEPLVLATHEQVLGGDNGQVYVGCRFPADAAYAQLLGRHGAAVGAVLARRGALGRFSVDFAAAQRGDGAWDVYALEINLRKGGTTHPYATLRNAAPGRYDVESGQWRTADGSIRCYESTDNLVDPAWRGRPPGSVIEAVRAAGLQFDPRVQVGVVLHMLSCLAIDGRFGATAIGTSRAHAAELYAATVAAVQTSDADLHGA